MSVYRNSIELFDEIGMPKLIAKRNRLTAYLESAIKEYNKLKSTNNFKIITPGKPEERGSQLSVFIENNGEYIYDYLKSNGVFLDWREPNVMRMAPVPLYNSFQDVAKFYNTLIKCI